MKRTRLKQIVVMSKYTFYGLTLQCLLASLLLAAPGRGQNNNVSIDEVFLSVDFKNDNLNEVFDKLEEKTGFTFAYFSNVFNIDQRFDASFKNESLSRILEEISKSSNLKFKRVNDKIYISKHKLFEKQVIETIQYQSHTVTGKVTSAEDDLGLPGVNIVVKGTNIGTVTDMDGKYSLEVPEETSTLVFSSVGFVTEEVEVNGRSVIELTLAPDVTALEEIVVVGYGSVKKSDLTGSVSTVSAEKISAYPAIGTVQALQGHAAGVQVQANNGEPGASFKVRIRGGTSINSSSDPLYVVDGFPGATLPPPEDIESIEILKDASATAIYGSRGANGVVMVTTKRGKSGDMKIDFNTSYSIQKEINRLDLLGPQDYVDYVNDANPGAISGVEGGTDWQDAIFQNGAVQNYQLSFSGGNENTNYYISGVVYDHKGIVIESNYKRYSITSNVNTSPSDRIALGANLFAQRTDRDGTHTQEGSGGTNNTGVISSAFTMAPSLPIYNDDGSFTLSPVGDPRDNPYAIATQRQNNVTGDVFQGNFYGELSILKDLKFRTTIGANIYNERDGLYIPTTLNAGKNVGGDARINSDKNTDLINENYFTYNKLINNSHDITVMAGYSYQSFIRENWGSHSQKFITDDFEWWNLDAGSTSLKPESGKSESELSSFYGRINYKLNNKYLITLNGRYDGSSRFAKNNKWAFFPSGAIAWNVAEESFMQDIGEITQFKLRASYGITGNQAIGPYESLAKFGDVFTVINGSPVNAVRPTSVANDNLTWESTAQFDIGVDLGLFNQRISLVADYYRMNTTDLLFSLPLPEYSGFPTMLKNIGSVENKGFELTLSTVNMDGDLTWNTDFNFSLNRNKVLELPEGNDILYAANPGHMVGFGDTHILSEGEPVGVFYGYIYDGVYQEGDDFLPGGGFEQTAGGEKFRDINGMDSEGNLTGTPDGQLNSDDRTIIGNPHPDFIWGMNNTLTYKGFDLNLFIQASQGNDIYSFTLMELELMSGVNNSTTKALDRWTPTNTDTDIPRANSGRSRISSSRWIMDGSYIRLKNISLGYQIPEDVLNRIGLSNARIYVSGQNLLTITDYRGYDPEVNYNTGGNTNSNRNLGLDYGSYPNAKNYTVGLQVKF